MAAVLHVAPKNNLRLISHFIFALRTNKYMQILAYLPQGGLQHAESLEIAKSHVRVDDAEEDHAQHVGQMGELDQVAAQLGAGEQEHHPHQYEVRCHVRRKHGVGERPGQQQGKVDGERRRDDGPFAHQVLPTKCIELKIKKLKKIPN